MKTTTMIKSLVLTAMMCMTTSMMAKPKTYICKYPAPKTTCTVCQKADKMDAHHNRGTLMTCNCMDKIRQHKHNDRNCKCQCHTPQTCNHKNLTTKNATPKQSVVQQGHGHQKTTVQQGHGHK